jgi:hypothetical protein
MCFAGAGHAGTDVAIYTSRYLHKNCIGDPDMKVSLAFLPALSTSTALCRRQYGVFCGLFGVLGHWVSNMRGAF